MATGVQDVNVPVMSRVLPLNFFARPAPEVAPDLLGKWICRRRADGTVIRARVTEVEAYDGWEDRASHAHRGETPRNRVMFGPPGRTYLYLCYGVHWLLNITTRQAGVPSAVLIRGAGQVLGPGRVTRFLELDGRHNLEPVRRTRGLWFEEAPPVPADRMVTGPRVGIDYAGERWKAVPWRFGWKRDGSRAR